jgi:hypothetical protein
MSRRVSISWAITERFQSSISVSWKDSMMLTSLELEESAAMAPIARAEREATMKEARILMMLV